MEKPSTKKRILEKALELFASAGFEATTMEQIADAVGIRKSSLYSHFAGKQEILAAIVSQFNEEYTRESLAWRKDIVIKNQQDFADHAKEHIHFLIREPHVSGIRKLLTLEQYRNPELSALQTKMVYADVLAYHEGMICKLIEDGVLKDGDREIMAAQFAFPISSWLELCDREPERESEVMDLIDRNVRQFFAAYSV